MQEGMNMRAILDIPESFIQEAMALTYSSSTKTDVIKVALQNLIQKEKMKELDKSFGKVAIDINLDAIRKR